MAMMTITRSHFNFYQMHMYLL